MDDVAAAQTADMAKSIAESSRAASAMESVAIQLKTQVYATAKIIERQKQYAAIQLRAYISPFSGSLFEGTILQRPNAARSGVPGIVMVFRNSGLTPAMKVISWGRLDVFDVSIESSLVAPPLESNFPITLSPGGTFPKELWFHRSLTSSEIEDVAAGIKAIYFYGRVEYVDCFDEAHFSNFRVRYNGVFPPPAPSGNFTHCQNGNDSD